jgi:hypothetical protein
MSFANAALGQIVLFVSRMVFIFPAAVFGVLFLFQRLAPHLSLIGYALTLASLFSVFLCMQELQEVGSGLMPKREKSPTRP